MRKTSSKLGNQLCKPRYSMCTTTDNMLDDLSDQSSWFNWLILASLLKKFLVLFSRCFFTVLIGDWRYRLKHIALTLGIY